MKPELRIHQTRNELIVATAEHIVQLATLAIADHGSFHLALAGGSTPKALYELLASEPFRLQIAWNKVFIYFGDERYVPHDHPDSNFNMANAALLSKITLPAANIHPIPTHFEKHSDAARAYAQTLQSSLPKNASGNVQFDLVLLGIGTDGHTASLFPDTSALTEREKLVTDVFVKKLDAWRITLSYRAINQARDVLILVEGGTKTEIVKSIFDTSTPRDRYPVLGVKPAHTLYWFLDKAAAALLP